MSPLRPHDLRCKLFCTLRGAAVCSGYQSSRQAWAGAVGGLVAQLSPCSATASRSCLAVCQVFQTSFPSLFSSMRNALPLVNTRPTPSCATSTSRSNYVPLAARGDPTSWARECRPGSRQNITKEHCQYPGFTIDSCTSRCVTCFSGIDEGKWRPRGPKSVAVRMLSNLDLWW